MDSPLFDRTNELRSPKYRPVLMHHLTYVETSVLSLLASSFTLSRSSASILTLSVFVYFPSLVMALLPMRTTHA